MPNIPIELTSNAQAVEGEHNADSVKITLSEELRGYPVYIVRRRDGYGNTSDSERLYEADGAVTMPLTEDILRGSQLKLQLIALNEDFTEVAKSEIFPLPVNPSLHMDGEQRHKSKDLLAEMVEVLGRVDGAVDSVDGAVIDAKKAVENAEQAVNAANEAKETANTAAGKADIATGNANTATAGANEAAERANVAAQNAESATGEATEVTDRANVAAEKAKQAAENVDGVIETAVKMQYGSNTSNCVISFVTDDGQITDNTRFFKKVFEPLGVPCSTALITSTIGVGSKTMMSLEQAKELKKAGWTVCSHTHNDLVVTDEGVTKEQIEEDFKTSSKWLKDNGFDHDIYVAPHGAYNADADEAAREVFRCLVTADDTFTNGAKDINDTAKSGIFDNYFIHRRSGIGDPTLDGSGIKTKEDMLKDIQYAVDNKLWLIFVMHSWKDIFSDENGGLDDLRDVVQYCINSKIKIVNLKDGLRLKGNKVDVGNRNVTDRWIRVNANGSVAKSEFNKVSGVTDNTTKSQYIKICDMYIRSGRNTAGVTFEYMATSFNKEDIINKGKVTAFFQSDSQLKPCSAVNFYKTNDVIPTSSDYITFYATENTGYLYGTQITIYAKINAVGRRLIISNTQMLAEEPNISLFNFEVSKDFVDITPNYTAETKSFARVLTTKPSLALSPGELAVDTVNKKVYIAYQAGYNKWLELRPNGITLGDVNARTSITVTAGDDTGNFALTTDKFYYTKIGNNMIFSGQIIGSKPGALSGLFKVSSLPKPTCNVAIQAFANSGFSRKNIAAFIDTDGVIVTDLTNKDFADSSAPTLNIIFSGSYCVK